MAIPQIVGSPSSVASAASQTITLGAGYSVVFITTQAQNLPTAAATQINHASSGWSAIVGTKGGAGASLASQYLYVFTKVTTNGETIDTGDSGVFQVYGAITVSGYNTSDPYEALTSGSGTFGTVSLYSYTLPSITTLGPDRLIIGMVNPRADTTTGILSVGKDANPQFADPVRTNLLGSSLGTQTNLGGGGGIQGFYGGWAADSDGEATGTSTFQASNVAYSGADTGYVVLAIKPVPVVTGAASLSGTGSLSATGTRKTFGAGALSGTGSLSASGTRSAIAAAALSGTGSLSATGLRATFGAAALTGTGSLTAAGNVTPLNPADVWEPSTDTAWNQDSGSGWAMNTDDQWSQS